LAQSKVKTKSGIEGVSGCRINFRMPDQFPGPLTPISPDESPVIGIAWQK
jgi:hypothetical protein